MKLPLIQFNASALSPNGTPLNLNITIVDDANRFAMTQAWIKLLASVQEEMKIDIGAKLS